MERHTEAESGSHFAALIEKRTGKRETFGVADVAAIYDVSSGSLIPVDEAMKVGAAR